MALECLNVNSDTHNLLQERSVWIDGPPMRAPSFSLYFEDPASVAEVGWENPFPFKDSPLLVKTQDTGYEVFTGEPGEVPQLSAPGLCWGEKQKWWSYSDIHSYI